MAVGWNACRPASYAARMLVQSDLARPWGTWSGEVNCWTFTAGDAAQRAYVGFAALFAASLLLGIFLRDSRFNATQAFAPTAAVNWPGAQATNEESAAVGQ